MAGMETWRLQKIQQKMMYDPEYRKRKQFAMIFSYGCEVTWKVKHVYKNGRMHQSVPWTVLMGG